MTMHYVQIITQAGLARSSYIEAAHMAAAGAFEEALSLMAQGDSQFLEAHKLHSDLIQREAAGNPAPVNLLLIHTEDQLMSAEQFKILSVEFIACYRRIANLEGDS